jgi:plastocyanin
MKKFALLLVIILMVITLVSGCSGYSSQPSKTSSNGASPVSANSVTLSNFSFSPATLTVKAGTTITWTNKDSVTHTIISDTGAFSSGNLSNGATFSYTFANRGSFAYHCSIHPTMKGTVIVE